MNDAWQSDDATWLKERKQQWKVLKKFLLKHDSEMRSVIKQSEQFYLYGTVEGEMRIASILRFWFHPDHSEQNWSAMLEMLNEGEKCTLHAMFISELRSLPWNEAVPFMGGDEARLLRLLASARNVSHMSYLGTWEHEIKAWFFDAAYYPNTEVGYPCYPYNPIPSFMDDWFKSIASLPIDDPEELKRKLTDDRIDDIKWLFCRTHFFIEPRGLSSEGSRYAQFCSDFCEKLSQITLPDCLQAVYEEATAIGNEPYSCECEITYDEDDRWELDEWFLLTRIFHSKQRIKQLLPQVVTSFFERQLCSEPFIMDQTQKIDISSYLNETLAKTLDYQAGEVIPAYRYRITTTRTYTNFDPVSVNYDVIELYLNEHLELNDVTPILFLLPRPNRDFIPNNGSFRLNHQWVQRVIEHQLGGKLLTYADYTSEYCELYLTEELRDTGNYFDSKIKPFNNNELMLDSEEQDFPLLTESLIPDYSEYCERDLGDSNVS